MIRSCKNAAAALLLAVSGCASVVTGTSQVVTVNSMPSGARCEVKRDGAEVQSGITPMMVSVEKSRQEISVSCVDSAGRQGSGASKSGFEPWFLGNFVIGGLVGMSIDVLDGAANKYDSPVWISLGGPTSQTPVTLDRSQPSLARTAVSEHATTRIDGLRSRPVSVVEITTARTTVAPLPLAPIAPAASRRTFLVRAKDVDAAIAVSLRMEAPRGVVLLDVMPGGAAASSGLIPGDVVLAFNGSPVHGVGDLTQDLASVPKGGRAHVTIWRNDTERSLMVRF